MEPKYNPNTPESGANTDPIARASEFGKQSLEKARSETERMADKVKSEGRRFFVEKKNLAAENVRGFAEALRMTARNLEERDSRTIADWAHQAADVASRWSDMLRNSDMDELSRKAGEMMRRNRGLLVGGAFVIGFMLTRFLKTSYEPGASETELTYRRRRPMEESPEPTIIAPTASPPAESIGPGSKTGTPGFKKPKSFSGPESEP